MDNLTLSESLIGLASQGVLFLTLAEIGKINAENKQKLTSAKDILLKINKAQLRRRNSVLQS